ncbi:hypothetical protein [Prescottella agglutinans]|uniref:Lipoprotein n=1 Tax=Prescottella agglutinans TaxID=1644129 RepID=A0ABT6M5K1_9NOCA|nr:hypothetical protein [Prescottella agglutinans]MDH6279582.1 hypothetical protein [Prescottella agglutinans]
MTERRGRLAATVAATAALAALAAGCSSTGESPTPGNSAHTTDATSSVAPSTPGSAGGQVAGVTTAQAAQLCSDMEAQLQNWRTYTPTLGKGGLNTVVISWATANGMDLVKLAGDRGQIDTITSAQCPQVRQGALEALEIQNLASGLIGF